MNSSMSNIATAINAAHEAVQQAKREGARHAVECGRLLLEAKETVAHGGWDSWLAKHCSFSARTAQLYMKVARYVADDPANAQRVADLSLRELGKAISKPTNARRNDRPLSDEGQAWLHGMLAIWYNWTPEVRQEFLRRLHSEAERQGVPLAEVKFPL